MSEIIDITKRLLDKKKAEQAKIAEKEQNESAAWASSISSEAAVKFIEFIVANTPADERATLLQNEDWLRDRLTAVHFLMYIFTADLAFGVSEFSDSLFGGVNEAAKAMREAILEAEANKT